MYKVSNNNRIKGLTEIYLCLQTGLSSIDGPEQGVVIARFMFATLKDEIQVSLWSLDTSCCFVLPVACSLLQYLHK